MGMADPIAELRPSPAHFTYFRHSRLAPWVYASVYQLPHCACNRSDILTTYSLQRGSRLTDFNHIHSRDGEDWVCGRSMAVRDEQMLHCEGRDPEEIEACRLCAERIIGYFGEPMHVH
jgi:hypothetical protein